MNPPLNAVWLDHMLEAERHDEALDALNAGLETDPEDAGLLELRGDFWAGIWNHREAAADWRAALALDPDRHGAALKLALLEVTRPYRLTRDTGEDDLAIAGTDDSDADWEAERAELEQMLLDALAEPERDDEGDPPAVSGLEESAADDAEQEDQIRQQGLARLQALADAHQLTESQHLEIATTLREGVWLPWHALDHIQRGMAAYPASTALQRARAEVWMGLATDTGDIGDEVPVGFSADLTGNLYHPVSAAQALQYCASLPSEAWDTDLHERRAHLHRLLGDHEAAAADFARAAALTESLSADVEGEAREQLLQNLRQLQEELTVCRGGDRALIAARQQQMQETLVKLAELQQSMGMQDQDDVAINLQEAHLAADEYIDTIGNDPLDDSGYVAEVQSLVPQIAEAILQTLESDSYDMQTLGERELHERVGNDDARRYLAERSGMQRLGYAAVGWVELTALSRRLGKPAILDLLLSPDQTTIGLCFVLGGQPTRELHTLFADGGSLSHATIRGRSAGWTPPPFRQTHLPADIPTELMVRLHESAVRQHQAQNGQAPLALAPSQLAEQLDRLRGQRYEARLTHGFHDAEIRGYTREHFRAGGDALRRALAEQIARQRPRTH